MTLQLTGDVEKFIDDQVKAGEYSSAQEVVFAGLRLLKQQTTAGGGGDFQPGEWDRLLVDAEGTGSMTLEELIARRRAERAAARAGR
jgi:Arc/MetJ-type ribon-helix-helix transcriptional regulator